MRSAWMPELVNAPNYVIKGDQYHHLVHVTRLEKGDDLLLLNGKGLSVTTKVVNISKKELVLEFISTTSSERGFPYDVAIGMPKKDALDLCLKQAVELGFRKIYLVRSAYSQTKLPEESRLQSVLVSALEQSNSAFMPEVLSASWEEIHWDDYEKVLMLDSQSSSSVPTKDQKPASILLVVGPEGGFSPEELTFLRTKPKTEAIHLPTPILRTPTALAAGAGLIMQRLLD